MNLRKALVGAVSAALLSPLAVTAFAEPASASNAVYDYVYDNLDRAGVDTYTDTRCKKGKKRLKNHSGRHGVHSYRVTRTARVIWWNGNRGEKKKSSNVIGKKCYATPANFSYVGSYPW